MSRIEWLPFDGIHPLFEGNKFSFEKSVHYPWHKAIHLVKCLIPIARNRPINGLIILFEGCPSPLIIMAIPIMYPQVEQSGTEHTFLIYHMILLLLQLSD